MLAHGLAERHEVTLAAAKGSCELFKKRFGDCVKFIEGVKPDKSNPEHLLAEKYKDIIKDFDIVSHHGWSRYPYDYRKDIYHTIHAPHPFYVSKSRSIAVSKAHQQLLRREQLIEPYYAYNAIDYSLYEYCEDKDDYLLFLSRICAEKGTLEFIDICRKTSMKGIIAGNDTLLSDYNYVDEVLYRCSKYGIEYRGEVSHKEKVELLKHAKALVIPLNPKYFEVFGLIAIEAMCCGTPVIVPKNGATPEVVKEGGFVVDSVEEIPDYIDRLDEIKPRDARKNAERFSVDNMVEMYLKIFASDAKFQKG